MTLFDVREHAIPSWEEMNSLLQGINIPMVQLEDDIIISEVDNHPGSVTKTSLSADDHAFLYQQYMKISKLKPTAWRFLWSKYFVE